MVKARGLIGIIVCLSGFAAYAGTELGNGRFVDFRSGMLGVRFKRPAAWQPLDGGAVVLFQDSQHPAHANRVVLEGSMGEEALIPCQWQSIALANGVAALHCAKNERAGQLRVSRPNGLDITLRYQLKGDESSHEALSTLLSTLEIENGPGIR